MLSNKAGPSTTAVTGQAESDMITQSPAEENPDAGCSTSINDSMLMSDHVGLDSSFDTVRSDDLEGCDLNSPMQDEMPLDACKMCKKRKNQIRKLKRDKWKLEKELNEQIKALELEKKRTERREKVSSFIIWTAGFT
jgi:hypothetical protein